MKSQQECIHQVVLGSNDQFAYGGKMAEYKRLTCTQVVRTSESKDSQITHITTAGCVSRRAA